MTTFAMRHSKDDVLRKASIQNSTRDCITQWPCEVMAHLWASHYSQWPLCFSDVFSAIHFDSRRQA